MTATVVFTTAEDAQIALASARKNYRKDGYEQKHEDHLIHLLTTRPENLVTEGIIYRFETVGDAVRDYLWNSFNSQQVSARVTREIFDELDRADETDSDWM